MYKRSVLLFVALVLCSLIWLPIVNLASPSPERAKHDKELATLFSFDVPLGWVNRLLFAMGISTAPTQTVIGREGWLYLGDKYEQVRSTARRGQTPADLAAAQAIGVAARAWAHWFEAHGVKLYRVMVAPDKETVYPEYLPLWAAAQTPTPTDALMADSNTLPYVDLRPSLIRFRASGGAAVYYRTDTHWNALGAGLAFHAFAQAVSPQASDILWPDAAAFTVSAMNQREGGDLARFLRLSHFLTDPDPVITAGAGIETTQYDLMTGRMLSQGGNPIVGTPQRPLRVVSRGALNSVRVLWLRDSFGDAMSPLMAATFSETVQLHWIDALRPNGPLPSLMANWRPDYVFVTVVERNARSPAFTLQPPALPTTK
jgi:hypothetical protein